MATIDHLLSKLNIHVSGACAPKHQDPIHCFRPVCQQYPRAAPNLSSSNSAAIPDASLRTIDSSAARDGVAIVYDRDITSLWRLPSTMAAYEAYFWEKAFESAIGQETILVAIEAFLDSEEAGDCCDDDLLRRFGEFIDGLGTRTVTITKSSIVGDMLDAYANLTQVEGFSWQNDLERVLLAFIHSHECFFYPPHQAPVVEATFTVMNYYRDELDVDVGFAWNPFQLNFQNLRNTIDEGAPLVLKPILKCSCRPCMLVPTSAAYFIGSAEGWLHWSDRDELFSGKVPPEMASQVGAERFETYTVALEITARLTKHYPGSMRFEKVIRCALPLTIRRRPSYCASYSGTPTSPPIARPASSRMVGKDDSLAWPPLLRSPVKRTHRLPRPPPQTPRSRALSGDEKENERITMEELHKLMARKAKNPVPPSPIRLNPLSLARFHEAAAHTQPTPNLTDVEVRTVHSVLYDPCTLDENKENARSTRTPKRPRLQDSFSARPARNRDLLSPQAIRSRMDHLEIVSSNVRSEDVAKRIFAGMMSPKAAVGGSPSVE